MKLVFFTQDSEIEELIENISGVEVVVTNTLDGLERDIEDKRCLFFIDFDFDKKYADQINDQLFQHENVRRIVISSGMRLKDLKKHQKSKHAAHGYLVKPLTLEIVNGVLNDYELSDYILDHQLESDEPDYDDIPLSDIGGKQGGIKEFTIAEDVRAEMNRHSVKAGGPDLDSEVNLSIQAKFDDVFGIVDDDVEDDADDSDFSNHFSPDGVPEVPDEISDIPALSIDLGEAENIEEDLAAGFKSGLSPEDGTGEFEIDAETLEEIEGLSADQSTEEVDMASDDIELDDTDLEFEDDVELEEGALEFDGGQDTIEASVSGVDDAGEDLEISNFDPKSNSDDSISLQGDDLEFGDDLDLGIEESPSEEINETEADSSLAFGSSDEEIDLDEELDLGDITNPTIVAQTENVEVADIDLDDEDIAEFSAQGPLEETLTESETDLDEDLDFNEGVDDDLTFGASNDTEEVTAATTIATDTGIDDDLEFESDDSEEDPTMQTVVAAKASTFSESPLPHGQVLESLGQPELLRLQATIKQLREERSGLVSQVDDLKGSIRLLEQDKLTLKAELEESRIEVNILKKRHSEENEESRHRTRVLEEKKAFFEEKARTLQKEFDRLSQKVRIDFNKVKQREKELESQLELVTMDSQSQVKSRDMKILELKRKIDSLEFNMENATIREQKSRDDKVRLEERLSKIMKTLRGSIKLLEDDIDLDDETRAQLEKSGKL